MASDLELVVDETVIELVDSDVGGTAAGAAAGSATAAAGSATAASASKDAAATSAAAALASKNAAGTSETNAATSAAAALASKNAAGTSETNAATSAAAALASKNAAGTSETNAATSAAQAASSAAALGSGLQNLLVNSTGELGDLNWPTQVYHGVPGSAATGGPYFTNSLTPLTGSPLYSYSNYMPVAAGVVLNIQGILSAAGLTAGAATIGIEFHDVSGTLLNVVSPSNVNFGTGPTFRTASGSGTAGTTQFRIRMGATSSPVGPVNAVTFQNIKVALGTAQSTYSQEANDLCFSPNPPANLSPIFQAVQALGTISGVNNPNLLPNSTGELGQLGWVTSNFTVGSDGHGSWWTNGAAISGTTTEDISQNIPIGAGVTLSLSYMIYTAGVTAGRAFVRMEAFNSSNASLGSVGTVPIPANGQPWAYYSMSGATPAGTTYVKVHKSLDTSPTVSQGGVAFARIKLEQSAVPTLYSTEASDIYSNMQSATVPTGNRNGFIDGACATWTDGVAATGVALSAVAGFVGPAMWRVSCGTGGAGTVNLIDERVTGALASFEGSETTNSININITTASTGTVAARTTPLIYQNIESVAKYAGKSVTFQVKLKVASGSITIPSVILGQGFGTGGSPSASVSFDKAVSWVVGTTWKKFSVRLDVPSIAGKTIGTSGNDVLGIGLLFPPGLTYSVTMAEFQVELCSPLASSDINGLGGAPTTFEHRGVQAERARVDRYYQRVDQVYTITGGVYNQLAFIARMRAVPAVALTTNAGTITLGGAVVNGMWFTMSYTSNYNVAVGCVADCRV
jgi:hypothetical protein